MTWLAVDKNGEEWIFDLKPVRRNEIWSIEVGCDYSEGQSIQLPKGSFKKLIGKELTWNDEPTELTEKSLAIESLNNKLITTRKEALRYYKERCEESPQIDGHEEIREEILTAFYQGAMAVYMD